MPELTTLHHKHEIEAFARRNPFAHLYELGDLDDFFWPQTRWYGWAEAGAVQQLALLYSAFAVPVLLANAEPPRESMRSLLAALLPLLPPRVYAHLDPEVVEVLVAAYHVEPHGIYHKMGLTNPAALAEADTSGTALLTTADEPALVRLYKVAYPGNWFDSRMLQTGRYVGIWHENELVSVAGVHVYAPEYGVAALGNVTTHPAWRGRGLAARVTARLCQVLLADGIGAIGLNVKADNHGALACYARLGFTHAMVYGEYMLTRTSDG
jgi:ribosomal protein S18 acetylase RimI-like enzyme